MHISVLLEESLNLLDPKPGETVLDCTLGLGGHAEAFVERVGGSGRLIGLDADKENLEITRENLESGNLDLRHTNFKNLPELNLPSCDIIFADLGLSSPHLDIPERGFSYRTDGPLDLRFDRSQGVTAAEWVSQSLEEEIADALWNYGEIKSSRKIARVLKEQLPKTTFELVDCIKSSTHTSAPSILPQVFQALRIAVNDELGALQVLLEYGPTLLKPGGRLGIISFHSLEDRMVKQAFRRLTTAEKDEITGKEITEPEFLLLTKRPCTPTAEDVHVNSRSRSAKLRCIQKTFV